MPSDGLRPVRTTEDARALALRRWEKVRQPVIFKGEWQGLYEQATGELLGEYAERGPQYRMLCELAAGLYVQTKRMEATGAIKGLDSLDELIRKQVDQGAESAEAIEQAQRALAGASEAIKTYLKAIEQIRRLVDQAQKYTEARKAEVVLREVNDTVVEVLLLVENVVGDPELFERIARAVAERLRR